MTSPAPPSTGDCPPALVETAAGQTSALLAALFEAPYQTAIGLERTTGDEALPRGWYLRFGLGGDGFVGNIAATSTIVRETGAAPQERSGESLIARWRVGDSVHEIVTPDFDLSEGHHRCALGSDEPSTFAAAGRAHPGLDPGWLPPTLVAALGDPPLIAATVEHERDDGRWYHIRIEAPPTWIDEVSRALVAEGMTEQRVARERRLTGRGVWLTLTPDPEGREVSISVKEE